MSRDTWDVIVVGSGIGGLACAAALAKYRHRVLVLEQNQVAGGLTHTFTRRDWTWGVGVHYLGDMGQEDENEGLLEWISGGTIRMASMGPVYDTIHFPGGFVTHFARPEEGLKRELKEKFPASIGQIDSWFDALRAAQSAGHAVFALRAMPEPIATFYRLWRGETIDRWCGRTTRQVLEELITDPRLRSVLAAQWGDYGSMPSTQLLRHSFGGGQQLLQRRLLPGGRCRRVRRESDPGDRSGGRQGPGRHTRHRTADGRTMVSGVETEAGDVSIGAGGLGRRRSQHDRQAAAGAAARGSVGARDPRAVAHRCPRCPLSRTRRGHRRDGGQRVEPLVLRDLGSRVRTLVVPHASSRLAPVLYVSFPSLKDPSYDPGPRKLHTVEAFAYIDWKIFARWQDSIPGHRPAAYLKLKAQIEKQMIAQFSRYFPALGPLIRYSEVSTPLSMTATTGAYEGAMFGIEPTPARFLCKWLHAKTPVSGLYLAGQDVGTPGVQGAMMGGILAAAAIEPKLLSRLG